jgi:CubicO group peptidase (beta-lactamase class C family)
MRKLTVAFAVLFSFAAAAQPAQRDDLDQFLRATLAAFPEAPGLSVAVVKDGKPLLVRGYGWANAETKRPMTASTPVYIASATKAYTGLLLASLAQRGILDLDVPIRKYLPELDAWPDGHRITLRALLTHSAGVENDGITTRTAYTGEHTTSQLIAMLPASKRLAASTFKYDNLGYIVASLIAERVTGTRWQDLLAAYVFKPLGMNHTTAYESATEPWGGLSTGYETSFPSLTNEPSTIPKVDSTMHAAGGIITDANDLARWLEANLTDGRIRRRQAIAASAVQETHKKQITFGDDTVDNYRRYAYGFGWYWSEYDGNLVMHHLGGYDGWSAYVSYMPKLGIGVAVVANTNGLGADVASFAGTYVYDYFLNKPGFDRKYEARRAELRQSINTRAGRIEAEIERRAKRTWMLSKPLDIYTGPYVNADFGTLVIRQEGEKLAASLGRLHATLEPFTRPETARVELIPGSGEVLRFTLAEDNARAAGVKWGDAYFTRTAD